MTHADCIFCKIVRGEIPCSKVHETANALAFLDIAPVNKGHALVIPKGHYGDIWELPTSLAPEIMEVIRAVGAGLKAGLGATGMNVGMNNGADAGQLVMHAHWHLIPRFPGDGLSLWPQKSYRDMDEMARTALTISGSIR
jgi:histidine triad (HIT) family protein